MLIAPLEVRSVLGSSDERLIWNSWIDSLERFVSTNSPTAEDAKARRGRERQVFLCVPAATSAVGCTNPGCPDLENPPVESAQPQRGKKWSLPADSRLLIGVRVADSAASHAASSIGLVARFGTEIQ